MAHPNAEKYVLLGALAALSILLIILYLRRKRLEAARDHDPQEQRESDRNRKKPDYGNYNTTAKKPKYDGWHPEQKEHHAREQFYWKITAILTSLITFGALASAVFAGFALKATWEALVEARESTAQVRKQADAAIEQAENMDRPWVKLIDLKHPNFTFPPTNSVYLSVVPLLKNVGRTTAVKVRIRIVLYVHKWENAWGDYSKEYAEACSFLDSSSENFGVTIFPDDTFDSYGQEDSVVLTEDNTSTNESGRYILAAVTGCVEYRFSQSPKIHKTRFAYQITHPDTGSREFMVGPTVGEKYIDLWRDPQYDYAD